eukprot:scaffold112_cov131-Alexandrium_tamarense.AAC.1
MLMSAQQLRRANAIDDTSIVGDVSALPYHGNMTFASISPYELHFPQWSIDHFMKKKSLTFADYYPPKEKEICLVHGYAIACALGWDSPGCKRNNEIPDTMICCFPNTQQSGSMP